ncbi:MAG: helix-turn-helix domain-containing protein [Pseudomonadales bacterium]
MTEIRPVSSVATGFLVLESLARHEQPLPLTVIAEELGSNNTKVYRHLQTLIALGYVTQLGNGGVDKITTKLRSIAHSSPVTVDVVSAAQAILPRLSDRLSLSVTLGRATGVGVEILEIARANTLLQVTTQHGAVFGLLDSAHGKVSLSFGSETLRENIEREAILALEPELDSIRNQGWAVAPGAILAGINVVAVPLLDDAGELIGSIAALGSLQSVPEHPPIELLRTLKSAAADINKNVRVAMLD